MTLNQYYDQEVKKLGYKNWNAFVAQNDPIHVRYSKKQMKQEYKALKKGETHDSKNVLD